MRTNLAVCSSEARSTAASVTARCVLAASTILTTIFLALVNIYEMTCMSSLKLYTKFDNTDFSNGKNCSVVLYNAVNAQTIVLAT